MKTFSRVHMPRRHPKISPPLFATLAHSPASPSSSRSSSPLSTPSSTPRGPFTSNELRTLATTLLSSLSHASTISFALELIHPTAQIQHEDNIAYASRQSFIDARQAMLERMVVFDTQILEAVADERDRKVWVRSVYLSEDRKIKDSVTTMVFDEEGLCVRSWDVSRTRRSE